MIGRCLWGAALTLTMLLVPAGPRAQVGAVRVIAEGAPGLAAGNGTEMLRGGLHSSLSLTLHGAFSVGHARTLSWDLLRASGMTVGGYSETVASEHFAFSLSPQSSQDLNEDGVPVRRFTWTNPPANTVIRVSVQRILRVTSTLTMFHGGAYPLSSVPADVQPYLQVTPSLRLSASQISMVRGIAGRQRSERNVVNAVANWVASNVHYDSSLVGGPYNASWVLSNRRATCQGYAGVMAGMLRALGIPAQVVYGWVSTTPLTIRSGSSVQTIQWAESGTGGTFHDWLNVYFPGTGWVAYDPQLEKSFADTRHYALLTAVDASDPILGAYIADPVGNQSVTGRPLANGGPEAVPEDGSLPAQVHENDSLQLHVSSIVHDVKAVTLFAR